MVLLCWLTYFAYLSTYFAYLGHFAYRRQGNLQGNGDWQTKLPGSRELPLCRSGQCLIRSAKVVACRSDWHSPKWGGSVGSSSLLLPLKPSDVGMQCSRKIYMLLNIARGWWPLGLILWISCATIIDTKDRRPGASLAGKSGTLAHAPFENDKLCRTRCQGFSPIDGGLSGGLEISVVRADRGRLITVLARVFPDVAGDGRLLSTFGQCWVIAVGLPATRSASRKMWRFRTESSPPLVTSAWVGLVLFEHERMGIYDRDYYRTSREAGSSLWPQSAVGNIILICTACYLLDWLFFQQDHRLTQLLALKGDTLFRPWLWWQFVTYGFAHDPAPFHIVFNMLQLFFLGRRWRPGTGRGNFTSFI